MTNRYMHIDIETFSSQPLPKCGVYRYCQSEDFEILIVTYAFDDEPLITVDLASGGALPQDFLNALEDPGVLKIAHNAAYERVCFSAYLGHWLDPHQWRCSMVMASYLTLPPRLADVAVALNLSERKMEEGKELIRFFSVPCKPTKANGGRTRNLPGDAPEKWEMYVKYNRQDVETERAVVKALSAHPLPESEWKLYALDQIINDRGVRVDKLLVKQAMAVDSEFTEAAYQRAKAITGLDNPGSVAQLKAWLADQDVPMESLAKKLVQEKAANTDGLVSELLSLRLELSKTSIKKYEAIARCVCRDGRVHGMLQFYGANRTGRWCLTGDHEVLTRNGWVRLDEWKGGFIACWNPTTEIASFQKASPVSFPYEGKMYEYSDKRIHQISTPDHKMWFKRRYEDDSWQWDTVEKMAQCSRPVIPFTGLYRGNSAFLHVSNIELRILVMVQADGFYTEDGSLRLHFTKQRKVERCKYLLRKGEIPHTTRQENNGTFTITVPARVLPLWLKMFKSKTYGSWLLDVNPDVFFDELPHWDGYYPAPNSIQYSTCNKTNADMVQALAHLSGRSAIIRYKQRQNERWRDAYVIDIWLSPKNAHEIRNKPVILDFKGTVYCAETSTGFFLVRRDGRVWITGNSGRLCQVQNLPQNHLEDLDLARSIVKTGDTELVEMLYGSVPNTLSELIRTALIPKEGCRFIVADFSAIEARVLAWLAGEDWVLDEFRGAGKIYEATASRMFHVPKESIVKGNPNYEYRQKGKQATLSCGYGGGVGALKNMGAKMPEEEMQPLVDAWRAANPHIVAFWNAMDRAVHKVIKEHGSVRVGKIRLYWKDEKALMRLPSGRDLCYLAPHTVKNRFGNDGIGYLASSGNGQLIEQETFGGKLVENCTQSVARDILAHAMLNLEAHGYRIVFHVHDECVIEMPVGIGSVDEACAIMSQTPNWCSDLPLRADGYECESYRKS